MSCKLFHAPGSMFINPFSRIRRYSHVEGPSPLAGWNVNAKVFFQVQRLNGEKWIPASAGMTAFILTLLLSAPIHKYDGIRPPMHPGLRRCSSVKYARYSPSSRLASRAPRRPRYVTVFTNRTTKQKVPPFFQNQSRPLRKTKFCLFFEGLCPSRSNYWGNSW